MSAETAAVLPLIALFALAMAWLVSLGVTHVRVVDAARESARAVARGEPTSEAVTLGARVAPAGSHFRVESADGTVVVTVRARLHGPAGLFDFLPGFDVSAQAVAAAEPGS